MPKLINVLKYTYTGYIERDPANADSVLAATRALEAGVEAVAAAHKVAVQAGVSASYDELRDVDPEPGPEPEPEPKPEQYSAVSE